MPIILPADACSVYLAWANNFAISMLLMYCFVTFCSENASSQKFSMHLGQRKTTQAFASIQKNSKCRTLINNNFEGVFSFKAQNWRKQNLRMLECKGNNCVKLSLRHKLF